MFPESFCAPRALGIWEYILSVPRLTNLFVSQVNDQNPQKSHKEVHREVKGCPRRHLVSGPGTQLGAGIRAGVTLSSLSPPTGPRAGFLPRASVLCVVLSRRLGPVLLSSAWEPWATRGCWTRAVWLDLKWAVRVPHTPHCRGFVW